MHRFLLCLVIMPLASAAAATCDSLTALKLPDTTITAADSVEPGAFLPPTANLAPALAASFKALPAFCRVQGVIRPSGDSHIQFEVWLPAADWNGKYFGIGNGGFAGSIVYSVPPTMNSATLTQAVASGYAASSTDTGHQGTAIDAQWALGHPEKIVDFGYRAIHLTAQNSKAIISAFYGQGPKHSYFASCSNGGRQALMEAQRFPADYDGIIAGAPAASFTHVLAAFIMDIQALEADPAAHLSAVHLAAIESAVLAACDSLDGLKDGLIDDPRKCHFDPGALQCSAAVSDSCLTAPQVAALRKIYAGARTSEGAQIYPGFLPGGETGPGGWTAWITGTAPGRSAQYAFATQGGAYLIFQKSDWDYRAFNPDRDVAIADDAMGQRLNAVDPNLKAFEKRGGKLLLYHGWSDAALAPTSTISYYESLRAMLGQRDAESLARLYMVPGMQHCGGGPGPNSFRVPITAALERWVESGTPPGPVIATKYNNAADPASGVAQTRPLCPYPQVARYTGSGSIDDAANFVCRAGK